MATNSDSPPPYVKVATIKGVVVTRRSTSGLWAGTALGKLRYAKEGFLSEEAEVLVGKSG